jgi:MFS family permease
MPPPAAAPASRPAARVGPNAALTLVAIAQFMVVLDATVVNVALPTIKSDVGFSEQSLSWVLNAYTLMFGGFLLLGGASPTGWGGAACSWPGSRSFPAPP